MTRRFAALTVALLAAASLATCAVVSGLATGHLDIEPAELQARISPRFPVQQCKLVIACLELAHPLVVLAEGDDRIGLTADARVTLGTRERTGRVGFSARPRYTPDTGQLFLDDVRITTLEFAGLPDDYAAVLRQRAPALINDRLQTHPVYTLNTDSTRGAIAKLAVQDVKVVNGKLRISFTPGQRP